MAGRRRTNGKQRRAAVRPERRRDYAHARIEAAATPPDRLSAAHNYLQAALARADDAAAERVAERAVKELIAHAERLDTTHNRKGGEAA